ncbi:MAG: hypothetical protein ACI86M_000625 [Saprospiraceae bacterium]|jgi:hypothetical protein
MAKAKRTPGPPPAGQEYGPTTEYAAKLAASQSSGQSGQRYCSYTFDNRDEAKKARRSIFELDSAKKMQKTQNNCDCD